MTKQASRWTSHLKDKKHKEEFAELVRAAVAVRERLSQMIDQKVKTHLKPDYELASWPYYQAHTNGYNEALKDIKSLLT